MRRGSCPLDEKAAEVRGTQPGDGRGAN